jgi:uncharacterized iron-regulated protein
LAVDLHRTPDLQGIIPELGKRRVVYIGETHDRPDHHRNQLEIIRALFARHPDLALGLEYFQQPFQPYLEQYIDGRIDEREMLKKTEYYERWRYDYRLYRPILRFARTNKIPLLALNLPRELSRRIAQVGIAGLDATDRAQLPAEIDRSDNAYRQRLLEVFQRHPRSGQSFERFVEAQLAWDETMAERAARYLLAHPRRHLVILAGGAHLAYRSGIPKRIERRVPVSSAVVLNGTEYGVAPDVADFLLLTEAVELPPVGRLGVRLGNAEQGGASIELLEGNSAAAQAGMRIGDQVISVAGESVRSAGDVNLALLDRQPGERIEVRVRRKRLLGAAQERAFWVNLR